jgi:hypothetical protein
MKRNAPGLRGRDRGPPPYKPVKFELHLGKLLGCFEFDVFEFVERGAQVAHRSVLLNDSELDSDDFIIVFFQIHWLCQWW